MEQTYTLSLSGVTQADVDELIQRLRAVGSVEQEEPAKVLSSEVVEGIILFCTVVKDVADTVTAVGGATMALAKGMEAADQIKTIVRQWLKERSRRGRASAEIITPDGEQLSDEPVEAVAENDTQS